MTRSRRLIIAAVGGTVCGVVALLAGFDPHVSDIEYDWISAKAALHSNAYADVLELAEEFGVQVGLSGDPALSKAHPRTPGAILVSLPLILVPFDWLAGLAVGVSVAFVVLIIAPTLRGAGRWTMRLAVVYVAVAMPVLTTIWLGTQGALVALLALQGWLLATSERETLGGWLIGIASTLKVFPGLLVVPLFFLGRRKAALTLLVSILLLNAVGLLLPGIALDDAVIALSAASETWVRAMANAGILPFVIDLGFSTALWIGFIGLTGMILVAYLVVAHRERATSDPLPWLIIGLLMIPLSWAHYDIILLPAVLALLVAKRPRSRTHALIVPMLWLVPSLLLFFVAVHPGVWFLVARTALLVVWLLAVLDWEGAGTEFRWRVSDPDSSRRPVQSLPVGDGDV